MGSELRCLSLLLAHLRFQKDKLGRTQTFERRPGLEKIIGPFLFRQKCLVRISYQDAIKGTFE